MAGFLRMLLGLALLPACWAFASAFLACLSDGAAASVETFSLLGGVVAFAVVWMVFPHPVKTYVFGHEMTHALWGMLFGARASKMKVGDKGGSVMLTKTNLLITLSPYFFPFYTFIVLLATWILSFFYNPLPFLPLWLFIIGFTWSFHILFTVQSLSTEQPDIAEYGRIFSWTFVFLANMLILIAWIAATTDCTFGTAFDAIAGRAASAYSSAWRAAAWAYGAVKGAFAGKGA